MVPKNSFNPLRIGDGRWQKTIICLKKYRPLINFELSLFFTSFSSVLSDISEGQLLFLPEDTTWASQGLIYRQMYYVVRDLQKSIDL